MLHPKVHLEIPLTTSQESACSALLARTQDTESSVLEALYSKPAVLGPVLLDHSETYLTELSTLIQNSKPKRSVLKAHLTFLMSHFSPKAGLKDVFHLVLFPLMLYSKPRQHSVELVWDAIENNVPKTGAGCYELLNGCGEIWAATKADGATDIQEKLATFNMTMASRIAENILASNDFTSHVDELVIKLNNPNAQIRLLALVVARALLRRLTGEHQVDTALKIVQTLDLQQVTTSEDPSSNVQELREVSSSRSRQRMKLSLSSLAYRRYETRQEHRHEAQ